MGRCIWFHVESPLKKDTCPPKEEASLWDCASGLWAVVESTKRRIQLQKYAKRGSTRKESDEHVGGAFRIARLFTQYHAVLRGSPGADSSSRLQPLRTTMFQEANNTTSPAASLFSFGDNALYVVDVVGSGSTCLPLAGSRQIMMSSASPSTWTTYG